MRRELRHDWTLGFVRVAAFAAAKMMTLGLMITTGSACSDESPFAASGQPPLNLTLQVYNYAQVPQETLNQAHRTLVRIFDRMNLRVRFQQNSIPPKNNLQTSPPALSLNSSEVNLWILLLPRERAQAFRRLNLGKDAFGFTPRGKDQPGQRAYLFVDRIKDLDRNLRPSRTTGPSKTTASNPYLRYISSGGKVLGHLIAHEVGHMCLPSDSHSAAGIMQAKWDRGVLDQIRVSDSDLLFTHHESELIRTEIDTRIKDLDLEGFEN